MTSERIGTKTTRQSKGAQKRLEVRGAGGCVRSGSGLRERRVDGMTEGKISGCGPSPIAWWGSRTSQGCAHPPFRCVR